MKPIGRRSGTGLNQMLGQKSRRGKGEVEGGGRTNPMRLTVLMWSIEVPGLFATNDSLMAL
jgi:hypothetical protein